MIASPWMRVWTKAVIGPAYRRAGAVWVGSAIAGAIVFGPTGLTPRALTSLALWNPPVGIALAATWLLMFVPVARLIVRGDAGAYLRALPAPTAAPIAVAIAALLVLQLPWLALWVAGQGVPGFAIVVGWTAVIAAIARWRPPPPRAGWPRWRRVGTALYAIYVRALRRRAGDAIVRGIGLALLAGAASGLVVRNNGFAGADAATLGTGAIAIVSLPAQVGLLLTLVETYRASGWLTASLGVSPAARVAALALATIAVYVAGTAIAIAPAAVVIGDAESIAWLAGFAVPMAAMSALAVTRSLVRAADSPTAAQRVVVGAIGAAAAAVFWLAVLGELGLVAMLATAIISLATTGGRE